MDSQLYLIRPELARRGLRVAERALRLERVRQREAYVRERVHQRAHRDLLLALEAEDPRKLVKRALGRHENLLSGYEVARARAWIDHCDPALCKALLSLLLRGERLPDELLSHEQPPLEEHLSGEGEEEGASLGARLQIFLSYTAPRQLAQDKIAHINETITSYLLAMFDPDSYPFVKLESTFQPAYRLLVDPDGERAPSGSERLVIAQGFYRALRELWQEHESFEGDLLDVHTRLFILGSGAYAEFSWSAALELEDLLSLIESDSPFEASYREPFLEAAELMREHCVDLGRPGELFHGMTLEDYAHSAGQGAGTLAHILEHGTRRLARLDLDSADAFGLSLARDGSWRVAGQDGKSREQAEAYFETRIKPMLREISEVAALMMGTREDVELSVLVSEPYRALDAKILLLTLCALDPDWSWHHLLPVCTQSELLMVTALLGLEDLSVHMFTDYLDLQFHARAAIHGVSPGLPTGAVIHWLRHHPLGSLLRSYLEVNEEDGILRDEQRLPHTQPSVTTAELATALEESGLSEASSAEHAAEDHEAHGRPQRHPAWRVEEHLEDAWGDFIAAIFDARHERLARLLRARKNVVLYGPPGTGKTVLSTQLATLWRRWQKAQGYAEPADCPCVEQVTFHPSYGYEEFIEGFRPRQGHPGEFVLTQGILSRMAQRAIEHPDHCFLLLIDELNRGDVARIFGELITLIEADKRSPEHARRRMLSQELLWLPPNLYLLATMNTADKSISLLDVAIRRRFAFERVPPQPSLLDRTPGIVHQVQDVYLSSLLSALNTRLSSIGVHPERWLGHSFLWLDERIVDDPLEAVATRFRLDIIPLVEEYCFADKRQMKAVLGPLVDEQGQPNEVVLGSGRLLDVMRDMVRDYQELHGLDNAAAAPVGGRDDGGSEDESLSRAWRDAYEVGRRGATTDAQRYRPEVGGLTGEDGE